MPAPQDPVPDRPDATVPASGGAASGYEATNLITLLGHAYSLLGFRIVDGVVGSGHAVKPTHSAVFAQIRAEGSRLTELAAGAGITPQSMVAIVDELEALGHVTREPDPRDRRAKLVKLTESGLQVALSGLESVHRIEGEMAQVLGEDGVAELRRMLVALLTSPRFR